MSTTLGQRIRAVRRRAKLTQDAFGASLGFSKRSLIAWETDAVEAPISILTKLRQTYDVDPEWIVMGDDEVPSSHYGPADWARFDRLLEQVTAVCIDVGLVPKSKQFAERCKALARIYYDNGSDAGPATRKHMRGTLLAISMGK